MNLPGIITLTTDLGRSDHYVASIKGTLLSLCRQANLVDITHEISPFNTLEAAFVLKSSFHKFPPGTVHIIGVDPEGGRHNRMLVMELRGHYFIAADNGVMSLIRADEPCESIAVDEEKLGLEGGGRSFLAQNRMAPIAAHLVNGTPMEELGEPHSIREYLWGEPSYTNNALRGAIVHVDHFGNALTNITKENFLKVKGSRAFNIFIRNLRLSRIVGSYGDVAKGEALAIFSDNDHLEFAIREGSASQLLGLKVMDMLTVEFNE